MRISLSNKVSSNNRLFDLLSIILILIASIDVIISTIFDFSENTFNGIFGISVFSLMTLTSLFIVNLIMLPSIKQIYEKTIYNSRSFKILFASLVISLIVVSTILTITIISIFLFNYVHILLKIVILSVSSIETCLILGVMSHKIYSWYRVDSKDSKVLLFYLVSMVLVSFSVGTNGLVVFNSLTIQLTPSAILAPINNIEFPILSEDRFGYIFNLVSLTLFTYIAAYISIWSGSVYLCYLFLKSRNRHRIKILLLAIGSITSYLVAIVPTLYSISNNQFAYDDQILFYYRILFKISVIMSGIFFGLMFIFISNTLKKVENKSSTVLSRYSRIFAFGIVLSTIITVTQPYHVIYPPFGILSHSLFVIASFMIAIGFYSISITISQELSLKKTIDKTIQHARMFNQLGTAQGILSMEKKLKEISKEKMFLLESKTGINTEILDDNIKQYVNEVLNERKYSHSTGV